MTVDNVTQVFTKIELREDDVNASSKKLLEWLGMENCLHGRY